MYQVVWPVWIASTIPAAVWLHPKVPTLTLQDLLTVLFYHWVVICITLILRNLGRLQEEAESVGSRLNEEVKKREEKEQSRKSHRRRR